ALLSSQPLSAFFPFGSTAPAQAAVAYDDLANRFVIGVLQRNLNARTTFLDFAVSNSSDATAGFTEQQTLNIAQITSGGRTTVAAFPRLGFNADAYVFTFNMDTVSGNTLSYDHTQVLTITKSSVLGGTLNPPTTSVINLSGQPNLVPAAMHGSA